MYSGHGGIVSIIEARMTSSRLPGKVLMPLAGTPALEMQISRIKRANYLDAIVIATTTNTADDAIAALAEKVGVGVFRGSERDVMGRVLAAAQNAHAETVVELTGDCPFTDPRVVDRAVEEFFSGDYDYAANTTIPTFPNGFDVQVFTVAALVDATGRTNDPVDRTHVSYYFYMHPDMYRCHNWSARPEERGPELRVTLDEQADYEALDRIARELTNVKPQFGAADVVAYLRAHPDVAALNATVRQKEAYEL